MEPILGELVTKLQQAEGDRLVSVILYGSAASEGGKDKLSDFNVLCVLREISPDELGRAEPVFRWWREMKNPSPLLLSEKEVRTSTDCFPIEFSDMKERRAVLFGPDVIEGLEIDYSFYRAQVEHEFRAKLLRLRQKAGGVLSHSDLLLRLMADSISTFCVLFRHAMLLAGGHPKFAKRDVVASARDAFGIDAMPLLTLIDLREQKVKARDVDAAALFPNYLAQIDIVLNAVDRMEKRPL